MSGLLKSIRVMGLGRYLYARLFYRHHMRIIHRSDKHQLRARPIDGLLHCAWCGHTTTKDGLVIYDGPASLKRLQALQLEAMRTGKIANPLPSSGGDGG